MKGRCISFTNEEITAMDKFNREFNTYFSPAWDRVTYEFLVCTHEMWLILDKFNPDDRKSGQRIYFSYRAIEFMADFICKIDSHFPDDKKHLKEKLVNLIGPAMDKFVVCFNENYGSDNGWWPPKKEYIGER